MTHVTLFRSLSGTQRILIHCLTMSYSKLSLDNMLNSCDIPEDILTCKNIYYSNDQSNLSRAHPGWNGLVESFQLGYEPAGLTVHPPPQNDQGWVHFFCMGV